MMTLECRSGAIAAGVRNNDDALPPPILLRSWRRVHDRSRKRSFIMATNDISSAGSKQQRS